MPKTDDVITVQECIERLEDIRRDLVPNSRDFFAICAGIAALRKMEYPSTDADNEFHADDS